MATTNFICETASGVIANSMIGQLTRFEPTSETASPKVDSRERRLIDRVLAGDHEAFYELVKRHERAIYIAAMSVLQNQQQAEDAAQETLLKAFVHLKRFRGESKFSTWLIQVAINEARMRLRKEHRALYDHIDDQREDEDGDYRPKDFSDWRPIPSEALANRELREAIEQGIARLTPRLREVFVLRDVQQLNIAETASILGITQQTVRTRLLRARLAMRDALAPFATSPRKAKTATR